MQHTTSLRALVLGAAIILAGCDDGSNTTYPAARGGSTAGANVSAKDETVKQRDDVTIVSATGDITSAVKEYRDLLGDLNQNVPGEQPNDQHPSGRREINWDGVPAKFTNNDALPADFFNTTSPRGTVFATDGSAFRVSDNGYIDVNGAYLDEFNTFSPKKLFVARGSTTIDVQFFVAGSTTPAVVTGFGSVFADVGRAHSTTIEFFDVAGNRLLKVAAPRRSDAAGLSFVGAKFNSAVVARVRITAGDTPIGPDAFDNVKGAGKKFDIVATDDFIYGEPRKIQ